MSLLFSLLTVAGTASLAFGGNTKDRLSYSENKHDYPSPSRDEWPSKKWASHKYDKPSGHAYGNRGPRGHGRRYGMAYSMRGDYHDQFDAENWRSSKSFDDNTYSFQFDPEDLVPVNGRGSAYSMHGHPRSSYYSSSDSKDSSEWSKSSSDSASSDDHKPIPPRPSGHAYAQRLTYHSSKQWKSPSRSDSASSVWKDDDSGDYEPNGHAYTKRSIPKQTYGNAFSMHKDEEPKTNWKKPSRDWKKNDGKYEPKKPQWAKDDYKPAHGKKDYEPQDHKDHYPSKDEPKYEPKKDDYEPEQDKKEYPSKDEPKEEGDDNHGTAWSLWDKIFGSNGCTSGHCQG